LLAHAGSDVETEYHTIPEIEAVETRDPLLRAAELLVGSGALAAKDVLALYEETRARIRAAGQEAAKRPRLTSVEDIVASLAPRSRDLVKAEAERADYQAARVQLLGSEEKLPERGRPRHLATLVSAGLADLLAKYPELVIFGEDVAKKGGVYHATADLQKLAGRARVFDTLLDETTILGLAIGAAHVGLLPCPEIQYLAYLHNAEDQLRGEACSLSFFSNGQFKNGMVVRIAGLGYQKGFGGHFHNDDAVAVLRDIPGLVVGVPARGDDAVEMQRAAFAAARIDGQVVVLLEPIALYMTKDLHKPGDGGWLTTFPEPGRAATIGEAKVVLDEKDADLSILTYGNGLWLSLRAARRLAEAGVRARVVDLRWLVPIDATTCVREARLTRRVLVVDECRRTAGPSEEVITAIVEAEVDAAIARVTAVDTYVPLGPAADLVLPSEDQIVEAAKKLVLRQVEVKS
jgi:2-oxoisovalerate dehydrogenase E1 component